jgi:hypothetical protein
LIINWTKFGVVFKPKLVMTTALTHPCTNMIPSIGEYKKIRIMLLAGGDLISSFGHPGVWSSNDVKVDVIPLPMEPTNFFLYSLVVASHCRSLWLCHCWTYWYWCLWFPALSRYPLSTQGNYHNTRSSRPSVTSDFSFVTRWTSSLSSNWYTTISARQRSGTVYSVDIWWSFLLMVVYPFRLFVKRGMSIKYLLPDHVIDYIHQHRLYLPIDPWLLVALLD